MSSALLEKEDDEQSMSSCRRSSPSARAFFAALDAKQKSPGGGGGVSSCAGNTTTTSAFVQKRLNVLGWRNRYSQSDVYPVTMNFLVEDDERKDMIHKHPPPTSITFHVRQVQRGEIDGSYGTGATVWPASLVLCHYLAKHRHNLVRNKRMIDLGTGTGVTSIAAAMLGAKHIVATDGMASVVELAKANIQSASLVSQDQQAVVVDVKEYWWGSGTIRDKFDVILVADCVLPKLYPIAPLVDAIDELLLFDHDDHQPQSVAILSYEHRYYPDYDPRIRFRQLCQEKRLVVETIPASEHDPVYSVEDIEIWHVYRHFKNIKKKKYK
jgi:predicted nicotinamide N-methyase